MINKDFFSALEDLAEQKKIDKKYFLDSLEIALTAAYKKNFGEAQAASVELNPEKSTIKVYKYKNIEDLNAYTSLYLISDFLKNNKNYVVTDGWIYKSYSNKGYGILKEKKKCKVSAELCVNDLEYNAKEKRIDIKDFYFSGVPSFSEPSIVTPLK